MTIAILCLGSNLGDREASINAMEQALGRILSPPVKHSPLMETEPVGVSVDQPWYLNRIIRGDFGGTAQELLERCLGTEDLLGRVRPEPKAPRTADIDLLLFGDLVIRSASLIIPHPELLHRRFCLEGLSIVAPELVIPETGRSAGEILLNLDPLIKRQKIIFKR